ncbi:hypothetical protein BHE90_007967 [Fusarium euwallaceae]|uniref:Uncharacterized protein n=1 Tax=Fusarium euwallaceae TaxID=1147111 RepID=A0A430LP98_9HYPO|nr:hypothetical protein BHE90_007967 [Fusarium euwallaceae]
MSNSPPPPQLCLLSLPGELRHLIYHFYFKLEGGYVFNREDPYNGKLATADGKPVDLSLMYVCRLIASEVKGLPLQLNEVSFSTAYHQDWSRLAGRFEYLSSLHAEIEADLARYLSATATPETRSEILLKFPNFSAFIRATEHMADYIPSHIGTGTPWQALRQLTHTRHGRGMLGGSYGLRRPFWNRRHDEQLHSTFQQAVTYALNIFRQKDPTKFKELVDIAHGCFEPHEFDSLRLDPWAIPSSTELARIGSKLEDEEVWENLQRWRYPRDMAEIQSVYGGNHVLGSNRRFRDSETRRYQSNNVCFREAFHFSAAAVAIRFLERLSPAQRFNLRHIVLHDDHVSVGQPECHAVGLIRFCRENPQLRVERYVSLWRNILHSAQFLYFDEIPEVVNDLTKGRRRCSLSHPSVSLILGSWLGEALAVMDAGMPAGSFTLILDGNPAINLSSEIFQHVIQRNVATERAYRRCFSAHLEYIRTHWHPTTWAGRYIRHGIDHLNNEASVVRCNFNIGPPWDVDKIVEERRGWLREQWFQEFHRPDVYVYNGSHCTLAPPLPTWSSIQLDLFEQKVAPKPIETKECEDGVGS